MLHRGLRFGGFASAPLRRGVASSSRQAPARRRYTAPAAFAVALGGTAYLASPLVLDGSMTADPSSPPPPSIQSAGLGELLRSYLVYTLCSVPLLIDNSPSLLHFLTHSPIPGLKFVTEGVVRQTFFAQFVAGESVAGCRETMEKLRSRGVGTMLNYSAEADLGVEFDAKKLEQARLEEVERALDEAGRWERDVEANGGMAGSTSFALKIVSLQYADRRGVRLMPDRPDRPGDPAPRLDDPAPPATAHDVQRAVFTLLGFASAGAIPGWPARLGRESRRPARGGCRGGQYRSAVAQGRPDVHGRLGDRRGAEEGRPRGIKRVVGQTQVVGPAGPAQRVSQVSVATRHAPDSQGEAAHRRRAQLVPALARRLHAAPF